MRLPKKRCAVRLVRDVGGAVRSSGLESVEFDFRLGKSSGVALSLVKPQQCGLGRRDGAMK